jgi:hypothetical protein
MSSAPVQAELLTVGAIFAEQGSSYVIPIYQRNYSWRQEQIEQLVDDVRAAARDPQQDHYFLGNLVVARAASGSEQPGERELEVIDGQQRLTTLSLLRAALDEDDWLPGDRLHYASRPKATAALATLRRSDDEDGTGIHTAYKIVQQIVDAKLGAGEERRQFADFLRDRVQLVRAVLIADFDLNHYFEIMNTRGQQLQQVDIVKARLLRHLADDQAAQVCFSWIWDACAAMDRYVQLTTTPGRPDLRPSIFGDQWDRLDVADFAQLQALCPDASTEPEAAGTTASDARGLRAALEAYAAATPREAAEEDGATRFRSPIEFPSLLLHVLKVLDGGDDGGEDDEGGLDDNKLIKIFGVWLERAGDQAPAQVRRFAVELLRCRFVLDNCVLKREFTATNGDDGAWSLKRLARSRSEKQNVAYPPAFRDRDDEQADDPRTRRVLLLQSMLRVTYTSPRTMHWITAVLRLDDLERDVVGRAADVEEVLIGFAQERVRRAFLDVAPQPIGFAIERIVFTYLDYLLARSGRPDFEFAFRNSIEHFFPQYPDPQQLGTATVPAGLHDFGKLALISVGANSKFSNNMPKLKLEFEQLIAQSPKLQEMAEVARHRAWDDQAIAAHGAKMLALLRRDVEGGI